MQYWSPIRAHAEWMADLREFIYGNGVMEPDHVVRDDRCEIGAWLYGEGERYRHLAEYEEARYLHAELHRYAAHLVILVQIGRRTEAAALIAPGGRIREVSAGLVRAFGRLNRRILALRPAEATDDRSAVL